MTKSRWTSSAFVLTAAVAFATAASAQVDEDEAVFLTQERVPYDLGITAVAEEQCQPLAIAAEPNGNVFEQVHYAAHEACKQAVRDSLELFLPRSLCERDGFDAQRLSGCSQSIGGLFESSDVAASAKARAQLGAAKLAVLLHCDVTSVCEGR